MFFFVLSTLKQLTNVYNWHENYNIMLCNNAYPYITFE